VKRQARFKSNCRLRLANLRVAFVWLVSSRFYRVFAVKRQARFKSIC
jgi:hypothetical protein